MDKKRIDYFDAVKGLAILIIIWGHGIGPDIFKSSGSVYLRTFGASFKLAVFYIVAGMLLAFADKINRISFADFTKKLAKALLIPYITFNIAALVFNFIYFLVQGKTLEQLKTIEIRLFYQFIVGEGISALWFLPTLFFGELLFYLVHKYLKWIKWIIYLAIIPASIIIGSWLQGQSKLLGNNYIWLRGPALVRARSLVALLFVAVGYYTWSLIKRVDKEWLEWLLGITFLGVTAYICKDNTAVDFSMMKFGQTPIIFFITGIIGSIGVILLFKAYNRHLSMHGLAWCGRNSLILMATHALFKVHLIPELLMNKVPILSSFHQMYDGMKIEILINTIFIMLVIGIIEIPIVYLFNTQKMKHLIGK